MQQCSSQKNSLCGSSLPSAYTLLEDNIKVTFFCFQSSSHSILTRNADWRDEESIFLSGLKVNSRNAKLYNNVGHALESQKRFSEALLLFKEAAKVCTVH